MSRPKSPLQEVFDPVRDHYIENFYQELSTCCLVGQKCRTEDIRRDTFGAVIRDGVLNLPSRSDCQRETSDTITQHNFRFASSGEFEPVDLKIDKTLSINIFPFKWDDLKICFETGDDPKRLLRLRLWFLEWFQPRPSPRDGELKSVVHSISGPQRDGSHWQISIDMGSAPSEALLDLIQILSSRGVSQMTVGGELDRVTNG